MEVSEPEVIAEMLGRLEAGEFGDPLAVVVYLAGAAIEIPADELAAAQRRALLLLVAGGDPHRELAVDDRAVKSLAVDLFSDARRAQLGGQLDLLAGATRDLVRVREAVLFLVADLDLAWRLFALGLLVEEIDGAG